MRKTSIHDYLPKREKKEKMLIQGLVDKQTGIKLNKILNSLGITKNDFVTASALKLIAEHKEEEGK